MQIRRANTKDIYNIAVLKQQVWIATYAEEGIRTEFSKYVMSEFTYENIKKTLEDKSRVMLIAETESHLLGCIEIALNEKCPVEIEIDCPEIAVLYVLERFKGKGIGRMLLEKSFEHMQSLNYKAAWLTVYHKNFSALEFYQKNQFKTIGSTNFVMDGNKYENKVLLRILD
ncbi:GNAT family N-acetyltransferase [Perlabentimonas gracilis]|uniref:GNAT family N-acetyltransferase n=1 Tax=Perlabentimonas gracilis TaxID=2715279 RepID=UPI00140DFBCF|nr:GNAT family N-acetyltransferase [Perlabentimonas gracilis]NHB67155.1 GNAT family N-acetyltransferase [Perlabentimonas gracilis]